MHVLASPRSRHSTRIGHSTRIANASRWAHRLTHCLCMITLLASAPSTMSAHAAPAPNTASASHVEAAKDVLRILRVKESIAPMVAQLSALISEQIEQWSPAVDQQPEVDKTITKLNAVLATELNWTNLEADYVVLYTENFNAAELKEIARFFRTGTGAKYVASAPAMQQKMLNISQLRMARVQPQVELLLGDLKRHLDTLDAQRNLAPAGHSAH